MSGNDFFDQLDLFDWYKDVVDTSIHDMITFKLNIDINESVRYKNILFYPVYTRSPKSSDKILKNLNLKKRDSSADYVQISIDEIEKTGASWEEFVDFLMLSDALLVDYKKIL